MPQEFLIEKPKHEDNEELTNVWEASVRETHSFLGEENILFFRKLVEEKAFKGNDHVYCCRDQDGSIMGFLGTHENKLEMIFIDPMYFGLGLGRFFVEYAIKELGADALDVNEQNPNAKEFYEHMGFEVVGRSEKDGMGKPFPLLHMKLTKAKR